MIDKIRKRRYEKMKQLLHNAKAVTDTSKAGWYQVGLFSGGAVNAAQQTPADLAATYNRSELVFNCVRKVAVAFASAPLQVGTYDAEDIFTAMPDHELLALFYENPYYDYTSLMELTISRILLTGCSYYAGDEFENRLGYGSITPIPTHLVREFASGPMLTRYEILSGAGHIPVDAEEMVRIALINPAAYRGFSSPLGSAMLELAIDTERKYMTKEWMRNRKIPGLTVTPDVNTNREQREAIRQSLTEAIGGESGRRGDVLVLPFKGNVTEGGRLTDIDFSKLNMLTETRIAGIFGVPPIVAGLDSGLSRSTFANYAEARTSMYRETLVPWWKFVAEAYTRQIPRGSAESKLAFKFDLSEIAELQDDKTAISTTAVSMYEAGMITKDEARDMIDLEPVGGEEGGFKEAVPAFSPFGGMKAKREEEPAPTPDRAIDEFPKVVQLEKAIQEEFKKQEKRFIAAIHPDGYIDFSKVHSTMAEAIEPILLDIAEEKSSSYALYLTNRTGGKRITRKEQDPEYPECYYVMQPGMEERIHEQAIRVSDATLKTTGDELDFVVKRIRNELADAHIAGGINRRILTDAVERALGGNAERWRALMIAVTESSRAAADAQILTARASGVVQGFYPLVSADACELCQVYSEDGTPMGQALYGWSDINNAVSQVGNYADEGRNLPPYHPHCRCSFIEIFTDEATPDMPVNTKRPQFGVKPPSAPHPRVGGRPPPAPIESFDSFLKGIVDDATA